MDYKAEEGFVRSFIVKNRRERVLYELTTPKKRYDGISRFCHEAVELLDPARIAMEGEDLELRPEFRAFVRKHDEICLVLSLEYYPENLLMSFEDAVELAVMSMDAVLILGDGFAVVFGEPYVAGRGKYLMTDK